MEIYLPIAEISQNIFFLLSIGYIAGVLSGMFGVGGGFLTTPILILSGVPPAVAVGSEANHIVGSSLIGFLNYFRRKSVDTVMGTILLLGGVIGSATGVFLFRLLSIKGRLEEVISFTYIMMEAALSFTLLILPVEMSQRMMIFLHLKFQFMELNMLAATLRGQESLDGDLLHKT